MQSASGALRNVCDIAAHVHSTAADIANVAGVDESEIEFWFAVPDFEPDHEAEEPPEVHWTPLSDILRLSDTDLNPSAYDSATTPDGQPSATNLWRSIETGDRISPAQCASVEHVEDEDVDDKGDNRGVIPLPQLLSERGTVMLTADEVHELI